MKKKIICTITEDIVYATTFFTKKCYAIKAMKKAGLTTKKARKIYPSVSKRKSTCGNKYFGEDLMALDFYEEPYLTDKNMPTLPLQFTIKVDEKDIL